MVVSSALLAVSPLGSIVAVAEDPPTTSAPAPTTPASDSTSSAPSSSDTAPGSSDATTTTGPSSSTTNPQGPSVDTVDPTTTTTPGDSTTSSSAPPLAVSAILQAANPFDATHGFTVLARHAGELRAGTTLGAVAVGGDLRFGPYSVTPTPPAQLDETPIGLLVGGSVGLGSSAGRLTVGDDARLLIGKVGAAQTAAVDGGVAVLPAGADVAADPQLRANGPQEPQTVSSPGTFERAFGGVFADLAARGRTLAKLKPTLTPTAADGGAIASAGLPRADVHLAAGDGDGPSVWSVHAADLAQIGSITIDPAPTEQRPLVINVDGDGGRVLLDRAVTVDAAARADIVWNVVDAKAVVVAQPLAGSLLAPTRTGGDRRRRVGPGGRRLGGAARRDRRRHALRGRAAEGRRHDDDHRAAPLLDPARHQRRPASRRSGSRDRAAGDGQQRRHHREGRQRTSVGQRGQPPAGGHAPAVRRRPTRPPQRSRTRSPRACPTSTATARSPCRTRSRSAGRTGTGASGSCGRVRPPAGSQCTPFVTGANAPFSSTPYQFRTGDQLRAGSTYASSGTNATFMLDTGNTNSTASGGIWQSSRNNPSLPATCGLSVALVLDVSGSVASSLASLKTAAKTFTNSLVGTPSQVALFTFATSGPGQHHEQPEPPGHPRLDPDRSRHA